MSREVADAAREALVDNAPLSKADDRFWSLLGGILYCGGCGLRLWMQAHAVRRSKERVYHSTSRRAGRSAR